MEEKSHLLRSIPKVDVLMKHPALAASALPAIAVKEAVHRELEALRTQLIGGALDTLPSQDALCQAILNRAETSSLSTLRKVCNATGVVLHTNLGRACLSARAAAAVQAAAGYCTLEYNVEEGCRGSRHDHVEGLLCQVTGAEAAMVVNNNAAAVLLILSALGKGGEMLVSRGELVEIGGSFRIPEIMTQCGCALREVGTTNKTRLGDYASAITDETRALLKVHTSNFRILGFTESASLEELVALGARHGLPVIQDLGSGSLVDLEAFGLHNEPTVQHSVRAGVDVICFSGDKLLGGPQAGIIIGKKQFVDQFKQHPLARALRVDKLTLAALRETLNSYLDPAAAVGEIPTLAMLGISSDDLRARAGLLSDLLTKAGVANQVIPTQNQVGGGSVPAQLLDGWAVAPALGRLTADQLETALRCRKTPIIGRIHQGQYLLDVRTLEDADLAAIASAVAEVAL